MCKKSLEYEDPNARRRKAIKEIKYCEFGSFARMSKILQVQSKKIAEAFKGDINGDSGIRLTEITIEIGIIFPPFTAKVGFKLE